MTDFGFYLVMTNPVVGYARCAEAAVKAGVRIIQLRMKHAERADILREAREIRRITRGTETLFIVNDDPSIAAEAEADGVHVGQDDMPARRIRNVLRDARDASETDHYGAGDETFHDFKENRRERSHRKPIDFIFVNNRVRVLSHGTINDFRNGLASSDHFPVTAEIVLLDAPEK